MQAGRSFKGGIELWKSVDRRREILTGRESCYRLRSTLDIKTSNNIKIDNRLSTRARQLSKHDLPPEPVGGSNTTNHPERDDPHELAARRPHDSKTGFVTNLS